jgi:beta-glucosidase
MIHYRRKTDLQSLDWGAQNSGLASAEGGLDLVMPSSTYWMDGNLTVMVTNGSLAQSRLDDMATRIVATWYKYAKIGNPGFGLPINITLPHQIVDARDPATNPLLVQAAVEGHVLVKNTDNALPLKSPKLLSIFGYDAVAAESNSPDTASFNKWSFGLENTQTIPGVGYFNATLLSELFLSSTEWNAPRPGVALNGTMISGGGSGATTPAFIDAPFDALTRRARQDNIMLAWDFVNPDPTINGASDACLVFVNELAAEGWDRPYLADPYSDTLIDNVAAKCSNTLVVIHNAGVRLVDRWIENPNITAVLYAHLPGQESGEGVVQVLFGDQSPSGRLPYTVAKNESDYGNLLAPVVPDNTTQWHTQINYTEALYVDYKHFIVQGITPRFEFGYGLTYSNFSYSELQVSTTSNLTTGAQPNPYQESSNSSASEGGDPALWDIVATASFKLCNTGGVAAAEVAQLYLHIPGGPEKVLRGFEKKLLSPGESVEVVFELTRRDLSTWDVVAQAWVLQEGDYPVFVGKSVLDIQLKSTLKA